MKKQQSQNPFKDLILDDDEQLLESAFELGEYEELGDLKNTRQMLKDAAKRHAELTTTKPVTIRINQLDLIKLKAKAKQKNVPYQTLLGALIREYTEGTRKIRL